MDPVFALDQLAKLITSNTFNTLIQNRRLRQSNAVADVADSVERLTVVVADLIGTTIRLLEVGDLTERAFVELSMLADASEDRAPIPAELALRLRQSLELLVGDEIEKRVHAVVDDARIDANETIGGVSVSKLLERYATVRAELRSVLNAYVHGASRATPGAASLIRSLTELAYLSRTLARVILVAVQQTLLRLQDR
jgi:hypothetical protein